MLWFGGSIAEAVNLSKQRNAIFVVFVEDDKDSSKEMLATLTNDSIVKRLSNEANFLAIKLQSGSENYVHFARMYHFVPVPSLFFIGRNGVPLEVVCAGVRADNLAQRIDKILDEHKKSHPTQEQSSTSQLTQQSATASLPTPEMATTNIKEQTTTLLNMEAKGVTPTRPREDEPETSSGRAQKVQKTEHANYDVICDGDVCVKVPKEASTSQQPTPSAVVQPQPPKNDQPEQKEEELSEEAKKENARKLIEARNLERAQKEKEMEIARELERRATGRSISELRKWQADQEMKQLQEERKRDKLNNQRERQRVLEQIAQDRAERASRPAPAPLLTPPAPPNSGVLATSGDCGTHARLQFKLPDGAAHVAHFAANDTLANVRRYVAQLLNTTQSRVSLWTALPRRELVENDTELKALGLAPSAALLVIETAATSDRVAARSHAFVAFITALFTSIMEPFKSIYNWVTTRLFRDGDGSGSFTGSGQTTGAAPGPGQGPGQGPGADRDAAVRYRLRSNIHSLRGDRNSDDENNTWNGNSTQQM